MMEPEDVDSSMCDICSKVFSNKHNKRIHRLIHFGDKPFSCTVCDKHFARKAHLKSHKLIHLDAKLEKCEICLKSFRFRSTLKLHLKIHTNIKPFACEICHKRFRRLGHCQDHTLIHFKDRPFKCTKCDKAFKQPDSLSKHLKNHDGLKLFKCDICHKAYTKEITLKHHMTFHFKEKPYKCQVCNFAFQYASKLKRHMITHERKHHFCDICNTDFLLKHDYLKHRIKVHSDPNVRIPCDKCNKSFKGKRGLKFHLERYCKPEKVKPQPTIKLDSPKKQHKCEVCDLTITMAKEFENHTSTYHPLQNNPYKCHLCKANFLTSSYLELHVRTHINQISNKCFSCFKEFNSPVILLKHQLFCNGNSSAFECQFCLMKFISEADLDKHKEVMKHNRRRPFMCCICNQTHAFFSNMQSHQKTIHNRRITLELVRKSLNDPDFRVMFLKEPYVLLKRL